MTLLSGHQAGKTSRMRALMRRLQKNKGWTLDWRTKTLNLPTSLPGQFPAVPRDVDDPYLRDPLAAATIDFFRDYPLTTDGYVEVSDAETTERLKELFDRCMPPLHESLMELAEREESPFIFLDWGTSPVATPEEVDAIYERELAEIIVSNME